MDLTHRFSVPVSVEKAWRALNHLELLDQCFPGLTIDQIAGDAFTGSIKVKLGPLGLMYAGSGRYVERDSEAHRLVLESQGADRRGNGTAEARVTATLTENGDGTDVEMSTDLTITGKPAQFGVGVIADVSDKLMAQFASCAAGRLAEGFVAPPVPVRPAMRSAEPSVPAGPDAVAEPAAVEEPPAPDQAGAPEEVGAVEDLDAIDDTVELGVVPEELDGPAETEPPTEPTAERPTPPPPPPGPYRYSPPSDLSEPHARTLGTAVLTTLRRQGPALGVGFLVAVVLIKIINRVRNR
jgi:carbon monoxide dehydrogenase subunit G